MKKIVLLLLSGLIFAEINTMQNPTQNENPKNQQLTQFVPRGISTDLIYVDAIWMGNDKDKELYQQLSGIPGGLQIILKKEEEKIKRLLAANKEQEEKLHASEQGLKNLEEIVQCYEDSDDNSAEDQSKIVSMSEVEKEL